MRKRCYPIIGKIKWELFLFIFFVMIVNNTLVVSCAFIGENDSLNEDPATYIQPSTTWMPPTTQKNQSGTNVETTPSPFSENKITKTLESSTSMVISETLPAEISKCTHFLDQEILPIENGINGVIGNIVLTRNRSLWELVGGIPIRYKDFYPRDIGFSGIAFSPDGNWFVYQKFDEATPNVPLPELFLVSSEGEEKSIQIPIPKEDTNGVWSVRWISNNLMLFKYFPANVPIETDEFGLHLILNPFTGEIENTILQSLPFWTGDTTVYFSPDLTRAMYVSESFQNESNTALILWDIENQKIKWSKLAEPVIRYDWKYIGNDGFEQVAFWSHDSSKVAFTIRESLPNNKIKYGTYLVNRDGLLEQELLSTYDSSQELISSGRWSPDNRFIYYDNIATQKSFLYDVQQNHNIELCFYAGHDVIWSPDGSLLAFSQEIQGGLHLLIYNVYTGEIKTIGEIDRFEAVDWINNESWLLK